MKRTIVIDAFYTELEYTVIKHIRNLPLSSAIAQFGGEPLLQTIFKKLNFVTSPFSHLDSCQNNSKVTEVLIGGALIPVTQGHFLSDYEE